MPMNFLKRFRRSLAALAAIALLTSTPGRTQAALFSVNYFQYSPNGYSGRVGFLGCLLTPGGLAGLGGGLAGLPLGRLGFAGAAPFGLPGFGGGFGSFSTGGIYGGYGGSCSGGYGMGA